MIFDTRSARIVPVCARKLRVLGSPLDCKLLALDTLAPARPGSAIRVTRPVRYSLYKSSDGSWQLGARDWNATTARFNTIQPVAGALLPPPGRGLVFSYFDSGGVAVSNPGSTSAGLALIHIAARAQARTPSRVLGAKDAIRRVDSLDAAVFLHNRR